MAWEVPYTVEGKEVQSRGRQPAASAGDEVRSSGKHLVWRLTHLGNLPASSARDTALSSSLLCVSLPPGKEDKMAEACSLLPSELRGL